MSKTSSTPAVSEVVLGRLEEGSKPLKRSDDNRVGLVVEGGGMRGVVTAGMMLGLEQLGMRDCFDFVVGTSAGAIASAFFATGKGTEGSVLYYEELRSPPFLDKRRLIRLRPALDLDYLVDTACAQRGLDLAAVAACPISVYATVTPVDPDSTTTVVSMTGGPKRVAEIMKATSSLPVLAGNSKVVDGEEYVDGGLTEQVPWRSGMNLGATHLLVLPSKPLRGDIEQGPTGFVERHTIGRIVATMHGAHVAALLDSLPGRATLESWSLRSIADGSGCALDSELQPWRGRLEVVDLPPDIELPRRLEDRRPVLVDAMVTGTQALLNHFGLKTISAEQRIVLNHPEVQVSQYRSEGLADIVIAHYAETRHTQDN